MSTAVGTAIHFWSQFYDVRGKARAAPRLGHISSKGSLASVSSRLCIQGAPWTSLTGTDLPPVILPQCPVEVTSSKEAPKTPYIFSGVGRSVNTTGPSPSLSKRLPMRLMRLMATKCLKGRLSQTQKFSMAFACQSSGGEVMIHASLLVSSCLWGRIVTSSSQIRASYHSPLGLHLNSCLLGPDARKIGIDLSS